MKKVASHSLVTTEVRSLLIFWHKISLKHAMLFLQLSSIILIMASKRYAWPRAIA